MQPVDPLLSEFSGLSVPEPAHPANPDGALAESVQRRPAAPAPAVPLVAAPVSEAPIMAYIAHSLWNLVLPLMFFLSIVVLVAYAAPFLMTHWRLTEAQAEAEATYLKRRAELKAEAEHADTRLDLLDKRVELTSLGFREVVRKVALNVVNVVNLRTVREGKREDGLSKRLLFFDPDTDLHYLQYGVGSGILVKPGYVLTNFHVVHQAQRLRVTFASGRSLGLDPDVVAADPLTDLAVLRLPIDPPANLREDI